MRKKFSYQINTPSNIHVDAEASALRGIIACEVGPAKGHTYEGMPEFADMKTLQMFKVLSNVGEPYVSRDHSDLVGSRIGYMTHPRIEGDKLLIDIEFASVAFMEVNGLNIGEYAMRVAADGDVTFIGMSFETEVSHEVKDGKAYLRPLEVYGISMVVSPALTNSFYSTHKEPTMDQQDDKKPADAETKVDAPETKKLESAPEKPADAETTSKTENPATGKVEVVKEDDGDDASPSMDEVMSAVKDHIATTKELIGHVKDLKDQCNFAEIKAFLAKYAEVQEKSKMEAPKVVAPKIVVKLSEDVPTPKLEPELDESKFNDTKYYQANKDKIWKFWKSKGIIK